MADTARREFLDLAPIVHAEGAIRLPGSKSISIRMLLLAALADGETRLSGVLDSDDTRVMRGALKACGVDLEDSGEVIVVRGATPFPNREAGIFVGNSGLSARTLVAALAFMGGTYRLSGVPRMHERPIADLVDALRSIGANIRYLANEGFLPIEIYPPQAARISPLPPGEGSRERASEAQIYPPQAARISPLPQGEGSGMRVGSSMPRVVRVRGDASSQFLTGLLQAGPLLAHEKEVIIEVEGELISRPYIDLTIELMKQFGVGVHEGKSAAGALRFTVPAGACYVSPTPRFGTLAVEGDASSASYFLALGALAGGPVRVQGMGRNSLQGDVRFADALAAMGATVSQGDTWTEARSPAGSSGVNPGSPSPCKLKAIDADFNHIPDAAMTLAVLALFADGPSTLRNIGSWRVKETDRIAAMSAELRKLGAVVDEGADFLRVTPPALLDPATIDTYDDHRVAMCFSLAACGGVAVRINDPGCVAKTFPTYFDELARLTRSVSVANPQLVSSRAAKVESPATGAAAPVIAIDGPTASGKGTVAQRVADALGFHLLDSGALYRLAALAAKNRGIRLNRPDELGEIAGDLDIEFSGGRVFLDGEDVTETIRAEWVGNAASTIAVFPELRSALVKSQHAFRRPPGLVADGRDMGTTIFPDAALKIFLTASPEARAERRHNQLIEKGISVNIETLLRDLHERDARDAARSSAPLAAAPDAVTIDTSEMGIEDVVARILALANGVVSARGEI